MEPRIYRAVRLMTADLERGVRLEELARAVNLSCSRLRHLFKEETGQSPAQYLKARRLEKARHLLESTFLSLKEVMHKSGFTDRSHFIRDFKKAYGLSPLQYRKQRLIAEQRQDTRPPASTASR